MTYNVFSGTLNPTQSINYSATVAYSLDFVSRRPQDRKSRRPVWAPGAVEWGCPVSRLEVVRSDQAWL